MRPDRILLLAAVLLSQGCYTFTPSSVLDVAPGEDVRVRLSAEAAASYRDLRLANPRLLEGTLVERTGNGLLVEAPVGVGSDLRGSRILVQQISVPNEGILEVDLKRLDVLRTGLLVGGGGAALVALVIRAGSGSGSEDGAPPDVSEGRRIPLLRFALPWGR